MTSANQPVFTVQNNNENPQDSPHLIRFCPTAPNIFVVASWDQTLRVYEIYENIKIRQIKLLQLPHVCLAMDFLGDGSCLIISLADKSIYSVDSATLTPTKRGELSSLTFFIKFLQINNLILTVNEQNILEFFNPQDFSKPLLQIQLHKEISSVDVSKNILLFGSTSGSFCFVDLNTIQLYNQADYEFMESQLKSPITQAVVNSETLEFCLCSCDGRVLRGIAEVSNSNGNNFNGSNKVKYVTSNTPNNQNSFIFVAHSKKYPEKPNETNSFHIHGSGFNPRAKHFFYTVGGDGTLVFWDLKERNRIWSSSINGPVNCSAINSNGTYLAFGQGYDWAQGVWGTEGVNYTPRIGIKPISDAELVYVKPVSSVTNKTNPFGANHYLVN